MARLLTTDKLKAALKMEYGSRRTNAESKEKRKFNIAAFLDLDRNGLQYMSRERQLLLYTTQRKEKIYIQYPGKESVENIAMPKDFRPKLQLADGSYMQDASFGFIWDIIDSIGKAHKHELSYVAAIFLQMGYMYGYLKEKAEYPVKELEMIDGVVETEVVTGKEVLEWYRLNISDDVWYTLNDRIGDIEISGGQKISFEAFIKFVDLLFQNEDCKYYYRNVVIRKKDDYKYENGRTSSSMANLQILNYLQGYERLSALLDVFQKSRGVPGFRVRDYAIVSDGIVQVTD